MLTDKQDVINPLGLQPAYQQLGPVGNNDSLVCLYCGKSYADTVNVILSSNKEWFLVDQFWELYGGNPSQYIGVCQQCQATEQFVPGIQCSCRCFSSDGFQCFSANDLIYDKQTCHKCHRHCHLQCSTISRVQESSALSLFGEHFQLTCMVCSYNKHNPKLYLRDQWATADSEDCTPAILEFPFPISLEVAKDTLASSLLSVKEEYPTSVGRTFKKVVAALTKNQLDLQLDEEENWEPEAADARRTYNPLLDFVKPEISIPDREYALWESKQIFAQDKALLFRFGGALRINDLLFFKNDSLPTFNLVEIIIAYLNCATVDANTYFADGNFVKRNNITTVPLSFMKMLMECGHKLGRAGIARFVQAAVTEGGLASYFSKDDTQVMLFPFQSIFPTTFILGSY